MSDIINTTSLRNPIHYINLIGLRQNMLFLFHFLVWVFIIVYLINKRTACCFRLLSVLTHKIRLDGNLSTVINYQILIYIKFNLTG